ncbi:MAG TPA: hypothetical protein VJS45_12600 [Acidimicrobiia bacterium]|nr:hypothetical protein [Acidimicrobiia bacterium]
MPVLEDTVDFKVATLNDLLDADVRTGVPVAADDKYKRWAFLSTGLAGMLLVGLILALVTGGGSDSGGSAATGKTVAAPPNTDPVDIPVGTNVPTGVEPGASVIVNDQDGNSVAGGTVTQIKKGSETAVKATRYVVVVAVPRDGVQVKAISAAKGAGTVSLQPGTYEPPTTTTTAAPSTTPTPIEPAPATPPPS